MIRSKQLLPFAKGARAWIVAGSVPKPNPLDGTGSPGSEDGKTEQGYRGTKAAHSLPPHVSRVEDSRLRRGSTAAAPKIHEGSIKLFQPGPTVAQKAVVDTPASISSKDGSLIAAVPVPAAADSSPHSLSNGGTAKLSSEGLVVGRAVKESSNGFVPSKVDSNGQRVPPSSPGKAAGREVGLATLSQGTSAAAVPAKHGKVSRVKSLDAGGVGNNGSGPLAKGSRTSSVVATPVQNGGAISSNRATAPTKQQSVGDSNNYSKATLECKPSAGRAPPSSGSTLSDSSNSRRSLASADLKKVEAVNNHNPIVSSTSTTTTTTAAAAAPAAASQKGLRSAESGGYLLSENGTTTTTTKGSCAAGPNSQQVAGFHGKGVAKGVAAAPEVLHGGIHNNSFVPGGSDAASAAAGGRQRSSAGGGGGGRKKVPSYGQGGAGAGAGIRQSHWSARDSAGGRDGASGDMVNQVGNILKRMGWSSQTVSALATFNSRLNAFHINEVLKHQKEPRLAWEFFNWAKSQNGYRHDVRTYTTMIGILGRVRNFEACNRLMEDMRREGCDPSVVTFNRLIHSYGRANYLGEALNLFHHMQEMGCQPDRVTYCTLIDLHSKAGFHDVAMDICQKMWQAGFEPDTFSYTLIIHCLGKAGNLPAASKLFSEMIDKGCTPNLVTYNIMIDLHAKAGKHHMALKLYNDMQDAGYRPDNVTYSVIMEVLGHSGHMDEAENVFIEMEQAGWTADATTFGSLVYMWGQTGNVKKATEWYKRMLDSGLMPNVPTCNSLLWAYMRVNDHDAAQQVLDNMAAWGLSPTLPTYTLLLSSCTTSQNQQHVDSTLLIMSRTGHSAHAFLCRLLNEVDSMDAIVCIHRFFDSLHGEEQENKRSFADALIEFLYKLDHKERAGSVWEVAVEKSFYPSAVSQRAPNYWIVDLHVMSMGTAVVALLRTLSSLRERMLTTGTVPDRIEIVTGWGKHSRVSGFSKIKNVVENILGGLNAPFYVDNSNVGCFVGSGKPLVEWLHQSDMDHRLAL